jgi:hypothetical protein
MSYTLFSFSQKYLQCAILKCATFNVWSFTTNAESMPVLEYSIDYACSVFPKIQDPPQNTRHKEQQILSITIKNLVAQETWHLGFVHPFCSFHLHG